MMVLEQEGCQEERRDLEIDTCEVATVFPVCANLMLEAKKRDLIRGKMQFRRPEGAETERMSGGCGEYQDKNKIRDVWEESERHLLTRPGSDPLAPR
jgi:hypothetical protein